MGGLEIRIPVSKAAREHHIDSRTLKAWLANDFGYDFSGGERLALAADVRAAIVKRTGKRKISDGRLRAGLKFLLSESEGRRGGQDGKA